MEAPQTTLDESFFNRILGGAKCHQTILNRENVVGGRYCSDGGVYDVHFSGQGLLCTRGSGKERGRVKGKGYRSGAVPHARLGKKMTSQAEAERNSLFAPTHSCVEG